MTMDITDILLEVMLATIVPLSARIITREFCVLSFRLPLHGNIWFSCPQLEPRTTLSLFPSHFFLACHCKDIFKEPNA